MKQMILDMSDGSTKVIEIPEPTLRPGGVLVKNLYSAISVGTENSILKSSIKKSLITRAIENPGKVKSLLSKVRTEGISQTIVQLKSNSENYVPLGYSTVGVVIQVADDVIEF